MKILTWNIEGLRNKLVDDSFVRFLCAFDIFGLTETWCTDVCDIDLPEFVIHSVNAVKAKKKGRPMGGVMVCVRKSIQRYVKRLAVEAQNIICLRISKQLFGYDKDVLMTCTY